MAIGFCVVHYLNIDSHDMGSCKQVAILERGLIFKF